MKDMAFEEWIARLRAEGDIVEVIAEYVPLKRKGKNYWGCCPFHHEKTPSFSVAADKGFFYCFGCQAGGNVINFLMKIENLSFFEAARLLAQKLNIPVPEKEKTAQELAREKELAKLYRANELAKEFFHSCLLKSAYGKTPLQYLTQRGISLEIIERFQIGFSPPAWDKLAIALKQRGLTEDSLIRAGLALQREKGEGVYDRFRGRVMIPITDVRGRIVGFGGRVLDDSQPKYLNSAESLIFNKRQLLFGFAVAQKAIRQSGQAVVMEGYMDVIAAHQAGIVNAVASLGTAFSPEQAKLLLRDANEIFIAYDSDAAGQSATQRALEILRGMGAKVRVISVPDGKDPDEYLRRHGGDEFRQLMADAPSLLEYQVGKAFEVGDASTLEGKVAIVNRAVQVLAASDNAVEINDYVIRLAQRMQIDESAVRSELRKAMGKHRSLRANAQPMGRNWNNQAQLAMEQAERYLLRLMWEDHSLIPYVGAQLAPDDFQDERRREIAELVLSGGPAADEDWQVVLTAGREESLQQELSFIMHLDLAPEDVVRLVDDCVKTIRNHSLQVRFERHKRQAEELERMGDRSYLQELAEMQRIQDEINKLRQG